MWREPLKWDEVARKSGQPHRVFCSSLADVFEDLRELDLPREWLWTIIVMTPHLTWQLLTKRPENVLWMVPHHWVESDHWRGHLWPRNVWIGTTVEDQKRADERIPHLLRIPAPVRFLSCEPLLEAVNLKEALPSHDVGAGCIAGCKRNNHVVDCRGVPPARVHWIICGGESGGHARRFEVAWAREIMRNAHTRDCAFFMKQMGAVVVDRNDVGFDADTHTCVDTGLPVQPHAWPEPVTVEHDINGFREEFQGADCRVRLRDKAGADPNEWPVDLRVQEIPA